ncbi:MAG: 4Fe-4S binding protein [Anaerolineae bacterium]
MTAPVEGSEEATARRPWSFLSSSTRAFLKEAGEIPGFSWFDRLHGYVYARWPNLYIGVATGEHPLARLIRPIAASIINWFGVRSADESGDEGSGFADAYHGKVVPLDQATQLVTVGEEITLTNLEQVIPYAHARDIVLKNPDHIAVLDCPCRASRPDPCEPLDVCLIVGEPFASFIVEHHPDRSRWVSPQEAVEILRAEDERGHVHHAFFKDAMLERFYAICNCCACCCGAMQAHRTGVPMLAPSGYVSRVHSGQCVGCGTCVGACPFGALSLPDDCAVVDDDACMGCGVCVSTCPEGALSLERDPTRGDPLDIRTLVHRSPTWE